jgi:cell division protein FtsQ
MSARVSLFAGILSGVLILGACVGALHWLLAPERFPVGRVEIKGNLKHTTSGEIEKALPRAPGNFFAVDLAGLRASLERLPWVRRVDVRRVWPATLEIALEEHVALARWGTGEEMSRLVNTHGETFSARTKEPLPAFVAPGGTAPEVTRRYRRFTEILSPLNTSVERVVLTQRHAWQVRLGNGLLVMLGRDGDLAEERLRRFVAAYPSVAKKRQPEYVDLRYPNGFALRVPDWNG